MSPGPDGASVQNLVVGAEEAEVRLDRWFRRHFPALRHGPLEKLLRTGQVRVDGRRAKAGSRLRPGQVVRVPPLAAAPVPAGPVPAPVPDDEAAALAARVLYRDDDVIALDKPAGLAVQGGTRTVRHLDAMLDALRFGAPERPRLVHRLDKDTSGVLLLARGAGAARQLSAAFRRHEMAKLYWALTVGVPRPRRGRIDLGLAKRAGPRGERVGAAPDTGARAVTLYAVIDHAGRRAAWLALRPRTGRTHQLRVHLAAIGTPILGDGKYGGTAAFLPDLPGARQLHLHARAVRLPHPTRSALDIAAPLPPHMAASWDFFGFDPRAGDDPFTEA